MADEPSHAKQGDGAEPGRLPGSLLVAMPQLADANFARSVVLLLEHDEGGTFGLILNRPLALSAAELCTALEIPWQRKATPADAMSVGFGGPVQTQVGWVLMAEPPAAPGESMLASSGLHLSSSLEVLSEVASGRGPGPAGAGPFRIFLGYAGWGPGQLTAELEQGSWLVAPADAHLIFETPVAALWQETLSTIDVDPAALIPGQGVH